MEVYFIIVLIIGAFYVMGKIIEAIGNYTDKKKMETKERVYKELFGNCDIQELIQKCKNDLKKIKYYRESFEMTENELNEYFLRTPSKLLLCKCPSCNEGFLQIRSGKDGKFATCSKCSYIVTEHTASINESFIEDFRKAYK